MARKVHQKAGPKRGSAHASSQPRGSGAAALQDVNARRQAAAMAKPGAFHSCSNCLYPRRVPRDSVGSCRCALPIQRLPNGKIVKRAFATTTRLACPASRAR